MKAKEVLNVIKTLEKYPIETIFIKHLMLDGINTEEKLVNFLKTDNEISQAIKVSLQNYYRDINSNFYDFNKIPLLFK